MDSQASTAIPPVAVHAAVATGQCHATTYNLQVEVNCTVTTAELQTNCITTRKDCSIQLSSVNLPFCGIEAPIVEPMPTGDGFADLQTDTVDRNQVSPAQMWVLLLGQLIFLVWLMVLRRVQVSLLTLPLTLP